MTETLLWYLWQLVFFHVGAYAFFDEKIKVSWQHVVGAAVGVLLAPFGSFPYSARAFALAALVMFFCMTQNTGRKIYEIGVLTIWAIGLGELVELPREHLIGDMESPLWTLAEQTAIVIFLLLICYVRHHITEKQKQTLRAWMDNGLLIMLIFLVLNVFSTVLCLEQCYVFVEDRATRRLISILQPIGLLSVLGLGLLMLHVRWTNYRLSKMQEQERKLFATQKNYYEVLLQKEEDTRKYRHDMENQLISLTTLAQKQKWDMLEEYLEGMRNVAEELGKNCYDTGNFLLDSLTSHLLGQADGDVQIHVKGRLDEHSVLEQRGLSIIYSNLLKNAVEAVQRVEKARGRDIWIAFQNGEHWTSIEIENTLPDGTISTAATHKQDKANHGFGLRNAAEEAERLHGFLETEVREHTFYAKIELPNRR